MKKPTWGPQLRLREGEEPRTLAGKITLRLREDIIKNRLMPGERLTFDKLSRRYGVGTSPLREALFQVAAEGLVVAENHKGFLVAPVQLGEMMDVSGLRALLETHAILRSMERGGLEWETSVLSAAHRLSHASRALEAATAETRVPAEDEWELRHREYHLALCSACGSPWLLHFFHELYDQLERYRRHYRQYAVHAAGMEDEHERIMEAVLARNAELAAALLGEHFRRQTDMAMAISRDAEGAGGSSG